MADEWTWLEKLDEPWIGHLTGGEPMGLGPGPENQSLRAVLTDLDADSVLSSSVVRDRSMAAGVLATLWLRQGDLDRSHEISQSIDTPTGSLLHGIMHRREGDFGNAKYWFHRTGHHRLFQSLGERITQMRSSNSTPFLTADGEWEPARFVDFVQSLSKGDSDQVAWAMECQTEEWWQVLEFCVRHATASSD